LPIGLIDTGVSVEHRGLAGAHITTATFLKSGETPANPRHGTAVAGILVGGGEKGAGLFTTGRLYAAAAAEQSRDGPFVRVDRAIAALDWLASQGVQLVNISLAGRNNNAALARAVRTASGRGMVIVAAAGNGGPDAPPAYPAAYDEAIAVTAIGVDRALYESANRGSYVDIAAPGVEIYAPGEPAERMWYFTGTSAAAPFVTARIAADPLPAGAGAAQRVRAQLARNATDLGRPGPDAQFGAGLIGAPASCR
jgi:subtilisin family serine protease